MQNTAKFRQKASSKEYKARYNNHSKNILRVLTKSKP